MAPVRPGKLALPSGDVRSGLIATFSSVLAHALEQEQVVHDDRVRAVHEFRKSVRRGRAILSLCRGVLPKQEFKALWRDLRHAALPTSELRDSDVFAAVLSAVSVPEELEPTAEKARTALSANPADIDLVARTLEQGVGLVQTAPQRFAEHLAPELGWPDIEAGLRRSYQRARKRRDKVAKTRKPVHFHDWRKRTKELNYQIELLTHGLEGDIADTRERFSDFATELGAITDRVNLAGRLSRDAKGKKRRRLAKTVKREGRAMLREAVKEGASLFAAKPKRFAADLVAQVREAREA